jgi:hypothetical protein
VGKRTQHAVDPQFSRLVRLWDIWARYIEPGGWSGHEGVTIPIEMINLSEWRQGDALYFSSMEHLNSHNPNPIFTIYTKSGTTILSAIVSMSDGTKDTRQAEFVEEFLQFYGF